ncbi:MULTISPECIES: hypothetical protein [Sphingomonas]|uniref:hypothetical protein n=1 Tax=Sphingomonas TaxID=13687 RepID=UPI000AB791B8|nr:MULTISPECIES: hypothetical protein [Sphingomonas]MBY0301909.1 hypothetical protein [Sphingomonas ginsenosidimutans]
MTSRSFDRAPGRPFLCDRPVGESPMRPIVPVAATVLAVTLLAACGSSEKSTTVGGTTFASDDSKGTSTITSEKGMIRATDGTAAAKVTMPAYAPLYPGAAVTGVIETENMG